MVSHTGMPVSPRNPPGNLQNPATPILSHAHLNPIHTILALSHLWTTFGHTIGIPPSTSLNTSAMTFVPRKPVTVTNVEGVATNLAGPVAVNTSVPPSPSGHVSALGRPNRPLASVQRSGRRRSWLSRRRGKRKSGRK